MTVMTGMELRAWGLAPCRWGGAPPRRGSGEEAGGVFGVVSEDDVGAGAADRGERFHHHAITVNPVVAGGGFDHGVFAGDLVGGQGHIEAGAGGGDNVEVGHSGLDHDHVRAFFQVELDFTHGFAQVGGVHLVAAAVAELRGGVGSFAEGTVEAGGKLGGVGEDGSVDEAGIVESLANGGHAAIHHVRRSDDVHAGVRQGDGSAGKKLEGGIVHNFIIPRGGRDVGSSAGEGASFVL